VKRKRPSKETVRDLYEAQRLTTRQIGSIYEVAHITVRRWLLHYGIQPRASHNGLLNRGQQEPTKEDLERLVHGEHHSYREIAAMFGVDFTAVPFWLKRHGIAKPKIWTTRRKEDLPMPSADELRELINDGLSANDVGRRFAVSGNCIASHCRHLGIPLENKGNLVHGETKSAEYKVWAGMKSRCSNPRMASWEYYGGRGIKVCERWQTFENFLADMGRRPTSRHQIDRINNDGDYEPGNCRWATPKENAGHRRSAWIKRKRTKIS